MFGRAFFITFLMGSWAATSVVIWMIIPVRPRFTLAQSAQYQVCGITDDSKTLVAFTKRAYLDPRAAQYWDRASSPIVCWDLNSGKSRSYCIPGESCQGEWVECADGTRRMLQPDGFGYAWDPPTIRGNHLIFSRPLDAKNDEADVMALNVVSGSSRFLGRRKRIMHWKQPIETIDPSPDGHWYCHRLTRVPGEELMTPGQIRILETDTGDCKLTVDFAGKVFAQSFSGDGECFACCVMKEQQFSTRVWRIETGELLTTIDRKMQGLAFSSDHRQVAGYRKNLDQNGDVQNLEFNVIKIPEGTVTHRFELPADDFYLNSSGSPEVLRFRNEDQWLVCCSPSNFVESEGPHNARLDLQWSWNLKSNQRILYTNEQSDRTFDVKLSEESRPEVSNHFILSSLSLWDRESKLDEIREITTGEKTCEIPAHVQLIHLSRTGRTMLAETTKVPLIEQIAVKYSIPVPPWLANLLPVASERWSTIDVKTGATTATMPQQDLPCWLSRDEKTLVTNTRSEPDELSVWDYPPIQSKVGPICWGAIAPAIGVLCYYMCLRRRLKTERHTSTST